MAIITLSGNTNISTLSIDASTQIRLGTYVLTLNTDVFANTPFVSITACDVTGGQKTGGTIAIPAGATRTLRCNLIAGTATLLTIAAGKTLNLYGNVTGGTAANAEGINVAGNLNLTGNIIGGSAGAANGITNSGTTVVTGNVTGGSSSPTPFGTGSVGIYCGSGTVTVTGNVTGGNAYGMDVGMMTTVTVTGTVKGGAQAFGIYKSAPMNIFTLNGLLDESGSSSAFASAYNNSWTWNLPAGGTYTIGGITLLKPTTKAWVG